MRHCHYTCDMCQRVLDPEADTRYVVHVSVRVDDDDDDRDELAVIDDDRDHLQELGDSLECFGDVEEVPAGADLAVRPFHFCSKCCERFLLDPLGRRIGQLNFSKN